MRCHLSLDRTVSRIRLAFIRTVRRWESKTLWFKVALVILKFWLKTVSLKPFTSPSHTLHTRLGAEAAAVAPQRARTAVYTLLLFIPLLPFVCVSIRLLPLHTNLYTLTSTLLVISVHSVLCVTSWCSSAGHIRAVSSSHWSLKR